MEAQLISSNLLNHSNLPGGIIYVLIFVPNALSDAAVVCVNFSSSSSLCFPVG